MAGALAEGLFSLIGSAWQAASVCGPAALYRTDGRTAHSCRRWL